MARSKVFRQGVRKLTKREALVETAVEGVRNGKWKNAYDAAKALKKPKLRVTIWRSLTGRTSCRIVAHARQQLLKPEQEKVLISYIKFLGGSGFPLSKRTIAPKVAALCGQKPNRDWVYRFLIRHPECTLGRPTGLDPKRAKAFNYTNVNTYFEQLQAVLDEKEIPWENVYNMDEIGMQLGGGRKGTGEAYFYSAADKNRYAQKSDDLELITVIETICGDGSAPVKPCFAFAGQNMCAEWFDASDGIL